jgi:hypothetical protein
MYKRELAQVIDGEGNTKEAVNMLKSVVYEGQLEEHFTEKIQDCFTMVAFCFEGDNSDLNQAEH